MIGRVTIPRRKKGKSGFGETGHPPIHGVYDVITPRHSEGPTGQKIVLNIDYQKRIAGAWQALSPIHYVSQPVSSHLQPL
jgi:hypothetical protein